jgi:hypothetical protein
VTAITEPIPRAPGIEIFPDYAAEGTVRATDPLAATSGYGRGTTTRDEASSDFLAAFKSWSHEMGRATLCATDGVGSPDIDTFEHNAGAHMKCSTCHP